MLVVEDGDPHENARGQRQIACERGQEMVHDRGQVAEARAELVDAGHGVVLVVAAGRCRRRG